MYFVQSILDIPWATQRYPARTVVSAMQLNSQVDHGPGQRWDAFVPQWQRSVAVAQYEIEEWGFGVHQGRDTRSYNGEYMAEDRRQGIVDAAQSRTRLYLFSPPPEADLPFFLCEKPDLHPRQYEVKVRLLFETFDQLPDVQASIGFVKILLLRQFEREMAVADEPSRQNLLSTVSGWKNRPYSAANLLKKAAQVTPFAGCDLPVETHTEAGVTRGVLHLREDLGNQEFLATLYLSDGVPDFKSATSLWRHLHWQHGERSGEVQLEVATILAINSATLLSSVGPQRPHS